MVMLHSKKLIAATIAGLVLLMGALLISFMHFVWAPSHVVSGKATIHLKFPAHTDGVWSVAFSPRGDTFASGSIDGSAKIWGVTDGQVIHDLKHPSGVTCITFSRNGEYLATSS